MTNNWLTAYVQLSIQQTVRTAKIDQTSLQTSQYWQRMERLQRPQGAHMCCSSRPLVGQCNVM